MGLREEPVDWESVTPAWKAGIKSQVQLEREFGVSRQAMVKHFGELGIERDLAPKIREEADRKLAREAVTAQLQAQEGDIVDANAEIQAQVRRTHRKDIAHLSKLCASMTEELAALIGRPVQLQQLIRALAENDDTSTLAQQVEKIISLPSRVASMERLASAMRTLVTIERQAWGIDDRKNDGGAPAGQVTIQF